MASILKVDTLTGVTTAGSISVTGEGNSTTTNLQQGLAKSWINFNGTGTIATRDSFNISSLSDEGTGNYSVTIASAMGNTNYSVIGAVGRNSADGAMFANHIGTNANTTTTQRVKGLYVDGGLIDMTQMCSSLLGDLA